MISHQFSRLFNLGVLHPPRGFVPLDDGIITHPNLVLEIGAGRGRHAKLYASQHPTHHLIAIERTLGKASDLVAVDLPNLTTVHADAVAWSVFALPARCLSAVFILYPNPEPKNRNQRFVNMPFFEFLLSRMKDGARLTIASNIAEYIDEVCHSYENIWRLPYHRQVIEQSSARTHFEIKYLAKGELCQEVIATKPANYRTRFDEIAPRLAYE